MHTEVSKKLNLRHRKKNANWEIVGIEVTTDSGQCDGGKCHGQYLFGELGKRVPDFKSCSADIYTRKYTLPVHRYDYHCIK